MRRWTTLLLALCALGACKNYQFDIEPDGSDAANDASGDGTGDVANDGTTGATIQLIGPISGSRATSNQPMFRWRTNGSFQSLRVHVYVDASMGNQAQNFAVDASATSATPGQALPPGSFFWQVSGMDSSGNTVNSALWEIFIPIPLPSGSPARSPGANPGPLDFNFDGHPDFAVAPQGGDSGIVVYESSNVTDATSFVQLPMAIGPVGTTDVDGDGPTDLIAMLNGNMVVYRGGHGMGSAPMPSQTIPVPMDTMGVVNSITGVSDVDGDGYGDVVLGSGATGSSANAVYVYRGGPSGLSMMPVVLASPDGGGSFGEYVTAGDFNNDGLSEIVVGEPTHGSSGHVFVYPGMSGGPMPSVHMPIEPPASVTSFGVLGRVGDVNGDGFADLVVGAPGAPGCVVAAMGGTSGLGNLGVPGCSPNGTRLGVAVTSAGDLDRDGIDDVLAGTVSAPVIAFMGSTTFAPTFASNPTFADPTMNPNANFADTISYVGDMTANGLTYFVVGAPDAPLSGMGSGPGGAYLFQFQSAMMVTNVFIPAPSSGAYLFGAYFARWVPSLEAPQSPDSVFDVPVRWTPPPALRPVG